MGKFSKKIVIGLSICKVSADNSTFTAISGIHKKGLSRDCRTNNICILANEKKSSLIKNENKKVSVTLQPGDVLIRVDRQSFEMTAAIYVQDRNKFYQYKADITQEINDAVINMLMANNIEIPDHIFDLDAA